MTIQQATPSTPRPVPLPLMPVIVRILAVLDAIALQSAFLLMIWSWPGHGGMMGAGMATLLVCWMVKRAWRAVFEFESYRWMLRYVVLLAAAGYLMLAIVKLQQLFS